MVWFDSWPETATETKRNADQAAPSVVPQAVIENGENGNILTYLRASHAIGCRLTLAAGKQSRLAAAR